MKRLKLFGKKSRTSSPLPPPLDSRGAVNESQASLRERGPPPSTSLPLSKGINLKYGLNELSAPSDAVVDIVLVHGLTGSAATTWMDKKNGVYWPTDLLKEDVPQARILAFNYDADVVNFLSPASKNCVRDHASNLIGGLTRIREKDDSEQRKIIFIAHSLGGLVVEDALVDSRQNVEEHRRQVHDSTIGIIFMGTPHFGSDLAKWARLGSNLASIIKSTNVDIVETLQPLSPILRNIQSDFNGLLRLRAKDAQDINITCFREELPVDLVGMIVDLNAATLPAYTVESIHANHMDMTKFSRRDDAGYEAVLGEVKRWIKRIVPKSGMKIERIMSREPVLMVPFERDKKFLPRSTIMEQIDDSFKVPCRLVLSGLGGAGKSQIAIEYCHRFHETYADFDIFFVFCGNTARFDQAFAAIAAKLEIPGYDDPQKEHLTLTADWLKDPGNKYLLVLDNIDDIQMMSHISKFLPPEALGRTLITTRDSRIGKRFADKIVELPLLDLVQARKLFRSRLPLEECIDSDLDPLLVALDGLPLAITQAASFLQECPQAPSAYLDLLFNSDSDIQNFLEKDFGDTRRDASQPEASNSVVKTWRVSFDLIRERNQLASDMLSRMALLDRQGIPENLLREFDISRLNVIEALGLLASFSLIVVERSGSYSLHRLVQLCTISWLDIQKVIDKQKSLVLSVCEKMFPKCEELGDLKVGEVLLPHAQQAIKYKGLSDSSEENRRNLRLKLAKFEILRGFYQLAEGELVSMLEATSDRRFQLETRLNLWAIYWRTSRTDLAEEMVPSLIKAYEDEYGCDYRDTLQLKLSVAGLYLYRSKATEAEQHILPIIKCFEEVYQDELDTDYLRSIDILISSLFLQNRFEETEQLALKNIEAKVKKYGNGCPDVSETKVLLGSIYAEQGKGILAAETLKEGSEAYESWFGPNHPEVLQQKACYGALLSDIDALDEAEKILVEVLQRQSKLGEEYGEGFARTKSMLSKTLRRKGKYEEAETLAREAIAGIKAKVGSRDRGTIKATTNLARILRLRGQKSEARELMEEALKVHRQEFVSLTLGLKDDEKALLEWKAEDGFEDDSKDDVEHTSGKV